MYKKAGMPQKLDPPKQISGKELGPLDRKGREHSIPLAAKKNIEDKGLESPTIEQP